MSFPMRQGSFARTDDERLLPIVAKTNICCGTLRDCTREQKNAFFACLEGYNRLYGKKELSQEEKQWSDRLFEAIKYIGSTNTPDRKEEFLKRKSEELLEILNKIGV